MLFATSLLSFLLVAVAWLMYTHHQQTLKQVELHPEWDEQKRNFLINQVQRRQKVTYTIMAIAVAILLSPAVPHNLLYIAYWGGICLLLLWIMVLAGIDTLATKSHILALRDQRIASRRALEEEVKRMREEKTSAEHPAEK